MSASASASASAPPPHPPASTAANDAWLESVLANPKNRDNLARLESALVTFMLETRLELALPPCSAFQRRVCVEVARRFGLEHRVDRGGDQGHDAVLLILRKSPTSAIPATMLSKLPNVRANDIKPKLVKRPKPPLNNDSINSHGNTRNSNANASTGAGANPITGSNPIPGANINSSSHVSHHGHGQSEHSAIKKVSQEEYEQARARIFNDLNGSATGTEQASISRSNSASGNAQQVRIVGGGIARGPEAGQSFARRRLAAGLPAAEPHPNTDAVAGASGGGSAEPDTARARARGRSDANQNQTSPAAAGDKDDPDFDRCYDKWARREHGSSASAGTPTAGGEMHAHGHMLYGGVYGYMPPPPAYVYHIPPPHPHPYYYTATPTATATPPHPHHNHQFHNSSSQSNINHVATHNQRHQHHTPAYGLDDAADFPPLSAAPSRKQRR